MNEIAKLISPHPVLGIEARQHVSSKPLWRNLGTRKRTVQRPSILCPRCTKLATSFSRSHKSMAVMNKSWRMYSWFTDHRDLDPTAEWKRRTTVVREESRITF